MRAFHNDPAVKQKYVNRVLAHKEADEIVQGVYWENGKGCAVGCTLHRGSDVHFDYPEYLGIPTIIAFAEDQIFERLRPNEAKSFPLQFLQAIPVGADLSLVDVHLALWMIDDEKHGIVNGMRDDYLPHVSVIVNLLKRSLLGETNWEPEWDKPLGRLRNMYYEPRGILLEHIIESQARYDSEYINAVRSYVTSHNDTNQAARNIRDKFLELLAAAPVTPENE